MRKNQQLVIVLPEGSEELPIRIVRGSRSIELRLCLCPPDGEERHVNETCPERKYVFIWRQNDYLKAAVDEIQWIEAAGSYSRIHLTGGRSLVISFNLASVRRKLPESDFIRIHRSRIVNLRHVETLVGNSLKIGNELLAISREYKDALFERVIFLGVRINIRKSLAVWDSCCIFVATNSATLPVEQRTRAELLLYIGLWNTRNDQ